MPATMTFEQWREKVNRIVEQHYGLSLDDLPDCCYSDWYEEGMLPKTAARLAVKNANE